MKKHVKETTRVYEKDTENMADSIEFTMCLVQGELEEMRRRRVVMLPIIQAGRICYWFLVRLLGGLGDNDE